MKKGYYIGHAIGIDYLFIREVEIQGESSYKARGYKEKRYVIKNTDKYIYRGSLYKEHEKTPQVVSVGERQLAFSIEQAKEYFQRELERLRKEEYNSLIRMQLNIDLLTEKIRECTKEIVNISERLQKIDRASLGDI